MNSDCADLSIKTRWFHSYETWFEKSKQKSWNTDEPSSSKLRDSQDFCIDSNHRSRSQQEFTLENLFRGKSASRNWACRINKHAVQEKQPFFHLADHLQAMAGSHSGSWSKLFGVFITDLVCTIIGLYRMWRLLLHSFSPRTGKNQYWPGVSRSLGNKFPDPKKTQELRMSAFSAFIRIHPCNLTSKCSIPKSPVVESK